MDVVFINAFVKAVGNVFMTMLKTEVMVKSPILKTSDEPKYDVSGIISVSGDMIGLVVLNFPQSVAEKIAQQFLGMPTTAGSEDFNDAIGELANMISGNAKASFTGKRCQIGCPSVIIGKGHKVYVQQPEVKAIELPCTCSFGDFVVEISLQPSTENGA